MGRTSDARETVVLQVSITDVHCRRRLRVASPRVSPWQQSAQTPTTTLRLTAHLSIYYHGQGFDARNLACRPFSREFAYAPSVGRRHELSSADNPFRPSSEAKSPRREHTPRVDRLDQHYKPARSSTGEHSAHNRKTKVGLLPGRLELNCERYSCMRQPPVAKPDLR